MTSFEVFLDTQDARIAGMADLFVKGVVQTLFTEVQVGGRYSPGTPIDTGFARGSWVGGIGSEGGEGAGTEAGAAAQLQSTALRVVAGDTVYMSNHAPYIRRLEFGHSRQAPQGMVRLAVAAAPLIAEEVAQHLTGAR